MLDGSGFAGSMDTDNISASGNITVSVGTAGDYSGDSIVGNGDFVLSAIAHTAGTGDIVLTDVDVDGGASLALGRGSGAFTAEQLRRIQRCHCRQ